MTLSTMLSLSLISGSLICRGDCGLVVVRWPWVSRAVGCGLLICGGLSIWVLGLGYGLADLGFG